MSVAVPYHTQLQPWEENQSPVEEQPNPYELSLTRSTSSGKASNHAGHARTGSNGPPSSVDTTNSLHRQLSGDPENPPPAWQRRPSVSTQRSGRGRSPSYTSSISATIHSQTSPIAETPKGTPSTRRHKGLAMTSVQDQSEESPVGMALADDPTLMLPQPAFRRRNGGSSSRSSIASSQDLSSLTSEELWNLDHEGKAGPIADMSNPMRNSAERPLDTVRRMSTRLEKTYQGGLPGEVIWPAVPAEEAYTPPTMSRSVTSMSSLKNGSKRMSRSRKNSRQSVIEIPATTSKAAVISQSTPVSPVGGQDQVFVHSTNSSSTSLASHNLHGKNKSTLSLNNGAKPPSTYYSRDFLSTLAPREGGYAIAAMLGNGLGAQGNLAVAEEKRRSSTMLYDPALGLPRNRSSMSMSRAPMSKSSGMGRWSLDGGEHYNKPYGSASTNTTSTSLATRTDVSPPIDELGTSPESFLPEGASPPARALDNTLSPRTSPPAAAAITSVPVNPSPLSQGSVPSDIPTPTKADSTPAQTPTTSVPAVAPAVSIPAAEPTSKKSSKQLAKEAKAAEKEAKEKAKADLARSQKERAAKARQDELKRQADKEASKKREKEAKVKAKEDAKREKERVKAERRASKSAGSIKSRTASTSTSTSMSSIAASSSGPMTAVPGENGVPPLPTSMPKEHQPSMASPVHNSLPVQASKPPMPAPKPNSAPQAAPMLPRQPSSTAAQAGSSKPAPGINHGQTGPQARVKLGMFGTLKKRLSSFGGDSKTSSTPRIGSSQVAGPSQSRQPPLPTLPATPPKASAVQQQAQPVSDVPVTNAQFSTPPKRIASLNGSPDPLSDLPPRSSSRGPITGSPIVNGSAFTSPQSFHSTNGSPLYRTASERSLTAKPTLASSLSKDATASEFGQAPSRGASPSSSTRRTSLSVRGPRPMPKSPDLSSTQSRPTSVANQLDVQHGSPAMAGDAGSVDSSSVSYSNTNTFSDRTESSRTGEHSSPFTSDAGEMEAVSLQEGSRKDNGVESLDFPSPPMREGSDDTIHTQGIQSAPVVSAH